MDELLTYLIDEMSIDYWYDDAIFICMDILYSFSEKDWGLLMVKIPYLPDTANVRLAEALSDLKINNALNCYKQLLRTNKTSVCFACIDAIRSYKEIIEDYTFVRLLLKKANEILSKISPTERLIVNDFVQNFSKLL